MTTPPQPAGVGPGFSNPIIGGGGNLVYPAIKSPNFSLPSKTGWAIMKDGSAYFFGLVVTTDQIEFDDSNSYNNPGGQAILYTLPAAATNDQSGLLVVGPTDGTYEAALAFWGESEDGTQQPYVVLFQYDVTTQAVDGGIPLMLGNCPSAPVMPGLELGPLIYGVAGNAQVLSLADGNAYDTSRLSLITATSTPTTSTTPIPITGLSAPVAAIKYRVNGVVWVLMGSTGTEIRIGMSGPTAAGVLVKWKIINMQGVSQNATSSIEGSYLMQSVTNFLLGPTLVAGANYAVEFDGWIEFSAAGTLDVVIGEQTSGDGMTAEAGSFMDVMPVTA